MNKEWVDAKNAEAKEEFEKEKQRISQEIINFGKFAKDYEDKLLSEISSLEYNGDYAKSHMVEMDIKYAYFYIKNEDLESYFEFANKIDLYNLEYPCHYGRYLDSESVSFDGDIIITDPCYIIRTAHYGIEPITDNDWNTCNYGFDMEALGINTYMTRDTIYGDWGCRVFNTDTNETIGEFCADTGLVSVFDLTEVLAYNPNFSGHTKYNWTTTLIKDFKGTVQFVVKYAEGVYGNTTEYHKAGDKWEDYFVSVVGHGVNKTTGKQINFESRQTGF